MLENVKAIAVYAKESTLKALRFVLDRIKGEVWDIPRAFIDLARDEGIASALGHASHRGLYMIGSAVVCAVLGFSLTTLLTMIGPVGMAVASGIVGFFVVGPILGTLSLLPPHF